MPTKLGELSKKKKSFRKTGTIIVCIILLMVISYPKTRIYFYNDVPGFHFYSLSKNRVTLYPGDSFHLSVNSLHTKCTYSSSNFRVAYVDLTGNVHALQKGYAVIKVKVKNGTTLKCYVTVKKKPKESS